MPPPESERGAALLTVLLLVAVIAVLAATALEKVRLSTRIAGNAAATGQARADAIAAETLATVRLTTLLRAQPDRVTLAGGWSGRPFPLPVDSGSATATVVDGGNCFNLNGLVTRAGPAVYVASPTAVVQFARLMRIVGIAGQAADSVAASTADWIDTDTTESPNGAEDGHYGNGATPYRTANTLMADPSELRAVAGVTPDIYARLRPWICTLPRAQASTINVDTLLPEQAPLIAMLAPGTIGVDQARAALLARPAAGYDSAAAFWASPSLRPAANTIDEQGQAGIKTQWFALRVDVAIGDARLEEHALIDATQLPPRLVSRQWGEQS